MWALLLEPIRFSSKTFQSLKLAGWLECLSLEVYVCVSAVVAKEWGFVLAARRWLCNITLKIRVLTFR